MLVDNENVFASNYPGAEIVFAHAEKKRMLIDKVTIKSGISTKTGAYPLGEGLIFLSDTLQSFENIDAFRNFNLATYQQWKKDRAQDQRALRQHEPVGYFQFDENTQLNFELDEKREAQYIMLLPTGFRQKPHAFVQKIGQAPIEI